MALDSGTFKDLITKIGDSSHGNIEITNLQNLLKKATNNELINFYRDNCICNPITWEQVKLKVWEDIREQEKNKFPFIQGDLINCQMVNRLGQSMSSINHNLWLVCTPTCDIVRKKYIKVAPVFPVFNDFKDQESENHHLYMSFKLALHFHKYHYFAIPPIENDNNDVLGYLVAFEEPFFIIGDDKYTTTTKTSLTIYGWHLLNMSIQ